MGSLRFYGCTDFVTLDTAQTNSTFFNDIKQVKSLFTVTFRGVWFPQLEKDGHLALST